MIKDRKTLLVVLGCIVALFAWQALVNKLYPPRKKQPKPLALTNVVTETVAEAATVAAPVAQPIALEPSQPRPAEQIVVLSNNFVRVEVTSWGGGIRSVELLRHKFNSAGNVILNGTNFTAALALADAPGAVFDLQQTGPRVVAMRGGGVTKQLALGDDYLLTGKIEVAGGAQRPVALVIGAAAPVDRKEQPAFLGVDWFAAGKYQNRALKHAEKGPRREGADAKWAAVKSQFFAMVLTPATNAAAVRYERVPLERPPGWKGKEPPFGLAAAVELPANAAGAHEFTFYAGPKEYDRLAALGRQQEEVMQFGMWGAISVVLLKGMNWSYRLVPNYGIAIIVITIIIKVLFWPIQAISMRSMKQMQKFQPLMQKLREKYKDEPQKLNAEMMKLYKEHKINPFSGCLPVLVQIPVFFALFAMLRSAIELRGAGFLWVKDLSQPDTVLLLAGLPVNPLPLLMTASMIWQQKLTPQTGDAQQQKMMMFMPLLMLLFFYNASSGLALYWTVQQLLSIAQQWWTLRQPAGDAGAAPGKKA
jgi:YidC/Oxa1 family membrane protein insertase